MTDLTPEQKDKRIAEAYREMGEQAATLTDEQFAAKMVGLLINDAGKVNAWQRTMETMVKIAHYRAASLLASAPASEPDAPRIDAAKLAEIRAEIKAVQKHIYDIAQPMEGKSPFGNLVNTGDRLGALLAMIGGQTDGTV